MSVVDLSNPRELASKSLDQLCTLPSHDRAWTSILSLGLGAVENSNGEELQTNILA